MVIITNAAGGINETYKVGDLMVIKGENSKLIFLKSKPLIYYFSRITRLTDASTFYFIINNRATAGSVNVGTCNFSLTQLGA